MERRVWQRKWEGRGGWPRTIKGWAQASKAVEAPRIFALFKSSLDLETPSWALSPSDPWRNRRNVAYAFALPLPVLHGTCH